MPHESLTVGRVEVIPLCDGWAPLPLIEEMPGFEVDWSEERRRHPWAFPPNDLESWAWHVHSFVLPLTGGTVVLVDTGIGHLGLPRHDITGRIEEELLVVGLTPGDVDHVVYTHLHADHAGGACLLDGRPRFPNARHHVHPEDWDFFGIRRTPNDFTGRFAMAALEELGMLELEAGDHDVASGVHVIHAPGHTPGHRMVRLDVGDEDLLLTGDLLHVPPQVTTPAWSSNHDEDPELASRTRARWIEAARANGWLLGVSHFGRPFGHVENRGWSSI
jgi:glyoxylase-like metal-dependent hydrolase (beta-lactamase superfamily II)